MVKGFPIQSDIPLTSGAKTVHFARFLTIIVKFEHN